MENKAELPVRDLKKDLKHANSVLHTLNQREHLARPAKKVKRG